MTQQDLLEKKIQELIAVMKKQGLWKKKEPDWIKYYKSDHDSSDVDFIEWLQFVYLPNRMLNKNQRTDAGQDNYITLQAKKYAAENLLNENMLQLLVELDGI